MQHIGDWSMKMLFLVQTSWQLFCFHARYIRLSNCEQDDSYVSATTPQVQAPDAPGRGRPKGQKG